MSPRRKKTEVAQGEIGCFGYVVLFGLAVIFMAVRIRDIPTPVATGIVIFGVTVVLAGVLAALIRKHHKQKQQEERKRQMEEERRKRAEQQEEERKRAEQEREEQIEALLERDAFRESVHYMSGVEFEGFMANVFDKKGYHVQTTPATGDQGVDLLLTIDDRKVAVQLKRYTGPVGNAAVQAVFAGMFHYKSKEAWVITTSSFTKGAVELAKSNRVRLIDGRELEDWLSDLRDEA